MKQQKNIFQLVGELIESKGALWIFPNKEESLSDSGANFLTLLLFIPLYAILLIVRILILLLKLIISLFVYLKKCVRLSKSALSTKDVILPSAYGLLIACTIFFSTRIMHETAKEHNVSLRAKRYSYEFKSDALKTSMPEDVVLCKTFSAILEAVKNEYTNREVVRLRRNLNIDEDFAKGLHFSSPDDFLLYLYSLKEIDEEVKPYINEADSLGKFDKLLDYYQIAALNDYKNGNYYNASAEVSHYFKIYDHQGDFPLARVNNTMHILRLLLQRQWELSTNREFAEVAYSCLKNTIDDNSFNEYGKLNSLSNGKPFLNNISTYFEGLSLFHHNFHMSALEQFETCYEKTNDATLKQYCGLMSIRTAFWNYDKLRNTQALKLYEKVYKKYSPVVTYRYFLPDLQRYQSVVSEIKNNPEGANDFTVSSQKN